MAKFLCKQCRRQRPMNPRTQKVCLRCTLKFNKAFLLKCFNSIVDQPDNQEFKGDMEMWYLNDA